MSGYVSAGAWPAAAASHAPPPAPAPDIVARPLSPASLNCWRELTLLIVGSQTDPDRVDRLMLAPSLPPKSH